MLYLVFGASRLLSWGYVFSIRWPRLPGPRYISSGDSGRESYTLIHVRYAIHSAIFALLCYTRMIQIVPRSGECGKLFPLCATFVPLWATGL